MVDPERSLTKLQASNLVKNTLSQSNEVEMIEEDI